MDHMHRIKIAILLLFFHSIAFATNDYLNCQSNNTFNVGAGIYDITGPAAEEGMMGYGMLEQRTAGIIQRLWARAFIIESPCNGKRIVFVNTDLGFVFQGIKQQVINKLKTKYGNLYSEDNVLITATHTHSGPGGFSTYIFYNLTTLGFDSQHFDTIINGIILAIERAQNNMMPAQLKFAKEKLPGISFNRSPQAYLENPKAERDYYGADVDTDMSLVRFDSLLGKSIGLINWFPLHGVSMNNKNYLINGDNKGYAEYLIEKDFKSDYGPKAFVAAFAQANAGDVSPNQYGHEGGVGIVGRLGVENAGLPQYLTAKKLFNQANDVITGSVDYRHTYVAMNDVYIDSLYTQAGVKKTCPAAIGVSMFAGTQDGEGVGKQGITCDGVTDFIPALFCEMTTTSCQGVKPIALHTGLKKPQPWTPNILPLQIIKIGNLYIIAVPFELTTMTGRRIKETVAKLLPATEKPYIVLSTLANAYSGYVATYEEYQMQRYEGASTHFGPWTEAALRQEYAKLAAAFETGKVVDKGPTPHDLSHSQSNLQPGVIFDAPPVGKSFGSVYQDVKSLYKPGDVVQVKFWGGHPKNNYRIQSTFLAIQYYQNGEWETVRMDRDWDTEYHWQRSGLASSLITITWHIPKDILYGQYRIVHYGDAKALVSQEIKPYTGYSSVFSIL